MDKKERDIWLEERRKGICGTDVAAILGIDEYRCALDVWQDKRGMLPDREPNEAMKQGIEFEDYIARRFQEASGIEISDICHNIGSKQYPWALCNPDRWIVSENAGLECKFTSPYNADKFSDTEFPKRYYTQCVHNMAVTGADHWYLAVLIACKEFRWYKIERNQEEIDALMEFERNFYENYLQKDILPDVDNSELTTKALGRMFINHDNLDYAELPELKSVCQRIDVIKNSIKELESEEEALRQEIMREMETVSSANVDGEYKLLYRTGKTRSFDRALFEKKYPEVFGDKDLWQEKESRVLTVRRIRGNCSKK